MSKKSKPHPHETKGHLAAFEQLPEETKRLMKLKDRHEKTSGPGQVADRNIDDKASK